VPPEVPPLVLAEVLPVDAFLENLHSRRPDGDGNGGPLVDVQEVLVSEIQFVPLQVRSGKEPDTVALQFVAVAVDAVRPGNDGIEAVERGGRRLEPLVFGNLEGDRLAVVGLGQHLRPAADHDVRLDVPGRRERQREACRLGWPPVEIQRVEKGNPVFVRDVVQPLDHVTAEPREEGHQRRAGVLGVGVPLLGVVLGPALEFVEQSLPASGVDRRSVGHHSPSPR